MSSKIKERKKRNTDDLSLLELLVEFNNFLLVSDGSSLDSFNGRIP
jgi:hypothetical protein